MSLLWITEHGRPTASQPVHGDRAKRSPGPKANSELVVTAMVAGLNFAQSEASAGTMGSLTGEG